jgi:aconitate decarboxylase
LGRTWEIETNAFKPFPCGIVCHPAIDAATQCYEESTQKHGLDPREIKSVSLRVHPLVVELTSKRKPKDGLEAKFSVFHGCAVGLLYGKAGPAQYADGVVTSSEVVSVRDKVSIEADTGLAADEAYLVLEYADGTRLEKHIAHAVGSLQVPMSDEHLTAKFIDQASLVVGKEAAMKWSESAWKIGDAQDVATIIRDSGQDIL